MAQCRIKHSRKSNIVMGISRFPRICVIACVATFLCPSTRGEDVPAFSPVYFTAEPSDVIAVQGTAVTLECSVQSSLVPTIQWMKDSSRVSVGDPTRTIQPNGALRIASVSLSDEGSYECSAELEDEDHFTSIKSRRGTLTLAKMDLQNGPASTRAYREDTVYFQCNFNSAPPPEIIWFKNGVVLDLNEERITARYTLMPSGGLEIREVRATDEGNYQCQGRNPLISDPIWSPVADLTVVSGTNPSFQFIKTPDDTRAPIGQTVVLEAATNSPAVFTWFKDGEEIFIVGSGTDDHYSLLGQGSLKISTLGEIDTGLYRVLATSTLDGTSHEHTVEVTAQVPLKFNIRPENTYANVGSRVSLNCNAYGIPGPTMSWYKDGDKIVPGQYVKTSIGSLTIDEVFMEEAGIYQCIADNQRENIQASAQLIVLEEGVAIPTRSPKTTPELKPPSPSPITTKSPPGLPDTGPVPSKPLGLNARDIQAQSFRLEWREPIQPNGELESYRIYLKWNGGQDFIIVYNLEQLSKVISDLKPDTRYEVTMYAINANGPGERSDVYVVNTLPPGEYLGPPTNVRARPEQESCTALLVTWDAPQGDVLHYKVYYADVGAGVAQELELYSEQSFYLITGLKARTRYGVRVVAFNENGPGASSNNLLANTSQCKPSGIPADITVEPESSTSILIKWEPPPANERNGLIDGYRLKYRTIENGKRTHSSLIENGSLRSHVILGLEQGTGYEVRMAAYNNNGTGPWSDWIQTTTFLVDRNEQQVPPVPSSLHATAYHNKIFVSWTPPLNNNIRVRGYLLGYGANVPDAEVESLPSWQTEFTIPDLLPNIIYILKLRAYNNIGEGAPLLKDVQTLPPGRTATPSTPIGLQALVTSPFAAVLTWTDLDYTPEEKPQDRYYTVKYTTNYPTSNKFMYVNSSESSVVIRNLSPFTTYQFEVMAVSGPRHSDYSLLVQNKTFEAAPGSAPRSLTVIEVENSTTSVILNWQPPKLPNGQISGYTVYYSTTDSQDESDWIAEFLPGDDMTRTIRGLTSDTTYYFKIQAHTSKGDGPRSDVVPHSTPAVVPVIVPPVVFPEPTSPAPLADAAAMGFPWWLWLVIILAILFIIIIAVLLLLCFMCGCCACCGDCCPCCAAACENICGCCAPLCGPLAACFAACCPCCCEDEDDCAKCWLKFCCGATACVCCGQAYRERRKSKASANLVGYHHVSQNGKVIGSTGPVPPDLWINHEGVEMKKFEGKKVGLTMSPISAKAEERERLDQGGGVDQQRDHVQETTFTQSSVQNQQESQSAEDQVGAANRQSQYETPTLISAASHRSSLDSDLHVSGVGSGAVHYATVDEMHMARKKSNLRQTKRQDAANFRSAGEATPLLPLPNPQGSLFAEPPFPPPDYRRLGHMRSGHSNMLLDIDVLPLGSSAEDFTRQTAPSITVSPAQSHVQSLNRSEVQNRSAGMSSSPRYATWGAKANQNDHQQSSVNYNTTNIHVEDVRNNYTDGYSSLRDGGYQGNTTGQTYSTLDRQSSYNNAHASPNQLITFPDQNAGPQPLTVTFEETTTSHTVEKSVPLPDGTNYKTSTSHQTFAKSYSTSDATQDQTLQSLLQGGIENGPLAVEIPSTTNRGFPAITAAPMLRSGSFNPIPQDDLSQSSGPSNTLGRSPPPPPSYNFVNSENASSQTQSSGYASGSTNARGRASSIGALSVDSMGYRSRIPESSHLNTQDTRGNMFATSPINIPPRTSSPLNSGFQKYESYRSEDLDYGRGTSDLYGGSSGITRPRAGFHTIDRSMGLNIDSAYGSPTGYSNGIGSYSGASTLGKPSGGLSVPSAIPSSPFQSSAFQNTSESFRAYNSNVGNEGPSDFSFNNNNDVMMPSRFVEVEHAEVQTPGRFNSKSDLLQSATSSPGNGLDFMSPSRPLRRSMSVDNEFSLENDGYWSSSSNTNLLSGYRTQRESKESRMSETMQGSSETRRGRSRILGDRTYGGLSSRSRSLDRFGEQEDRHVSPIGGYDYHMSSQQHHHTDRPAYTYPTNTASSGYHSDTNTTSSHDDGSSTQGSSSRAGNPLSSFSVPGPPPNYQPAKVKIQAPAYSPLKRTTQPGVARVRAQPLPVVTPRAPDVTYRGVGDGTSPGTANRSFSTEDLNTEMLNLEGLMKDLNAITASELQS